MAKLRIVDGELQIKMRWLERIASFYWGTPPSAPISAVESVRLVKPTQSEVEVLVLVPIALNLGTPGRLNTTLPRARTHDGEKAFLVTRRFAPTVVVEFYPERAIWRRWVISDRNAESVVNTVRSLRRS